MKGTLDELDRRLRREGFRPGSPSTEAAVADAGTCARMACTACGLAGLELRPYVHPDGGYRPLAVCLACGWAEEI